MAGKHVGQPTATGTPTVSNLHLFGSLEKCTLSLVCKQQKDKLRVVCRKP